MKRFLSILLLPFIFSISGCVTTGSHVKSSPIAPKQEVASNAGEAQVFDLKIKKNKIPDVLNRKIDKNRYPQKWALIDMYGQPSGRDVNYFYIDGKEQCFETWYWTPNTVAHFENGKLISIRTLNPTHINNLILSPPVK